MTQGLLLFSIYTSKIKYLTKVTRLFHSLTPTLDKCLIRKNVHLTYT